MSQKKFKIVTLGCRTNQYESQGYADQLKQLGYQAVQTEDAADLCIVNTCTVTHGADRSSRQQIRALLKAHPAATIAVTGCMAEEAETELKELDPRIAVVLNRDKEKLLEQLIEAESFPEFNIKTFEGHTRAFVKVQDGCNSFCTYCIIPYVRGRSRSRPMQEIIQEVKGLVSNGYLEVVLTGINVGDFDGGGSLAELVRQVDRVEGLKRLRISSIDPDEVNEELASIVLNGRTTCPSMHIVLQAGSNVILKRMNRKYTRQMFLQTVEAMMQQNPDFTVTTDVIVGFPGETEQDFEETLEMVETVKFAKVHVFPFSARKRTRAALFPNQVAQQIIQERKQRLLRAQEKAAFQLREKFLGRTMEVLMEEGNEGHTANFLKVIMVQDKVPQNQLVQVRFIENTPQGLIGCLA